MTEEKTPGGEAPTGKGGSSSEILDELESLGQRLATAVKSLWESNESRKLRQDLEKGFVELGRQVETAVKSARESEAGKQFSEQVKETMDKARESDLATKLEKGLVSGLQGLNDQLTRMVGTLQEEEEKAGPSSVPPAGGDEPESASEA